MSKTAPPKDENSVTHDRESTANEATGGMTWRVILLVIFLLVPLVNFGVPAFLESQNRFADDPETRVNAAPYAFAIWGVIFTGMIAFSAYLLFSKEPDSVDLRRALICLSIAGIASNLFVPISIYGDQIISWFDILLHLIPLILANIFLRRHAKLHPSDSAARWSWFGPSMYFGWISAATVISTALMANQIGIELGDSLATTVTAIVVVTLGAVGVTLTLKRDPIYGATVAWALIAVGVEQSAYPNIRTTAWIVAGVVICAVIYQLTKPHKFFPVGATDNL